MELGLGAGSREPLLPGARASSGGTLLNWARKQSRCAPSPPRRALSGSSTKDGDSWAEAATSALPITLMNLLQAYTFAQFVCHGTALPATYVAAMHILGMLVVQSGFVLSSAVAPFSIASNDVTAALLAHELVAQIYARVPPIHDAPLPHAAETLVELSTHAGAGAHIDGDSLASLHATALASVCVSAALLGCAYLALGRLGAAEIVLYLPASVVSALLGVVGLAVAHGALCITIDAPLSSLSDARASLAGAPLQILAALALALGQRALASRLSHGAAFLLAVPSALVVFLSVATLGGASFEELRAGRWLFTPSDPLVFADLWTQRDLGRVDWQAVVPDPIAFTSYALVCAAATMLKVHAVEAAAMCAVDLNAELCVAGWSTIAAGVLGGASATHAEHPVSNNSASSRRVGVIAAALCAVVLISGVPMMNVMPRFVLGGELLVIGIDLCFDNIVTAAYRRVDAGGLSVLVALNVAYGVGGMALAAYLGMCVCVVTAHLCFTRLNVLKYHLTARAYHSQVSRPLAVQAYLNAHAGAVHLVGLEGRLFDGTAARLSRYIERACRRCAEMRYIVLDMALIQGVDASAVALLARLRRRLNRDRSTRLIVANLQPELTDLFRGHGVLERGSHGTPIKHTVESALEWCEDEILINGSPPAADAAQTSAEVFVTPSASVDSAESARSRPDLAETAPARGARPRVERVPLRPYRVGEGGAILPFAPAPLPQSIGWQVLQAYATPTILRRGERLTTQGGTSRELWISPPSGAHVAIVVDVGHGPLTLASVFHGGVFGAEGALLALPSATTAVCHRCAAPLLRFSSRQLGALSAAQPHVHHQLLRAAASQHADCMFMLARRTALWVGGGWAGPNFDDTTAPRPAGSAESSATGAVGPKQRMIPSLPSMLTLPEGFGRRQYIVANADARRAAARPRLVRPTPQADAAQSVGAPAGRRGGEQSSAGATDEAPSAEAASGRLTALEQSQQRITDYFNRLSADAEQAVDDAASPSNQYERRLSSGPPRDLG